MKYIKNLLIAVMIGIVITPCFAEDSSLKEAKNFYKAFIFKANEVFKIERTQFLIRKSNFLLQKLRLCKISAVSAGHNIDCPLLDENIAIQFENDTLKQLKGADFDV